VELCKEHQIILQDGRLAYSKEEGRRLLKGKKYSDERIPTIEEIRKVFEQQIKLLLSVYNNNEPICKGMV
jgi:hypothetical protein